MEVGGNHKNLQQFSPKFEGFKKSKKIRKEEKIIVRPGNGGSKLQQNLFKITDPELLDSGIRNSIDRLTGKKIKNSFAEKQEILLKRGLMRFNQKKKPTNLKHKKKIKFAPNFKKTMLEAKGKKFFRKMKKLIFFQKTKWKQFSLFYFKSRGLESEIKMPGKGLVGTNRTATFGLTSKLALLQKIKNKKGSEVLGLKNIFKNMEDYDNLVADNLIDANIFKLKKNLVSRIHDNTRLVTSPMQAKSFAFLQDNLVKNQWSLDSRYNHMHNGSLIKNSQEIYLQSKIKADAGEKVRGYNDITTDLKTTVSSIRQQAEYFNTFLKQCFYKNLLFRSFWFNKFIGTLVRCGKKRMVWGVILKSLGSLKVEFGKNPVLILFEILEVYRMPLRALPPKDKTRKVIVRTHMVSWWKQYTQILRWLRHSFVGTVKNHTSWNNRITVEISNLLNLNHNTLIRKKCDVNIELVAFGKVNLHFRWYRKFSQRAANAIKIIDGPLYNKDS